MQQAEEEYVAVRQAGRLSNCIFMSWEDAAEHLAADLQGAKYKVFHTLAEAESYVRAGNRGKKRKAPVAAALPLEKDEEDDMLGDDDSGDENDKMGAPVVAAPKALFGASSYRPTKRWEAMFQQLAALSVDGKLPETFDDPKLKAWVKRQNFDYNKLLREEQSAMSEEKVERLASLGFKFKKESIGEHEKLDWHREFDFMMDKLHAFRKEYGSCRVMRSHEGHRDLFNWTIKVRKEYQKLSFSDENNKCRLSARQLQRLTDIGFLFRQKDCYKNWQQRMDDLLAYQAAGNDINEIPTTHPDLGEFVCRMRKEYRQWADGNKTAMSNDRIEKLEAAGFDWSLERRRDKALLTKPKTWEERYRELIDYKQQHGDTIVPQQWENGLGNWVKSQRQALKAFSSGQKSSLNAEKVSRLTAIGFVVDVKEHRKRQKQDELAEGPGLEYESPFNHDSPFINPAQPALNQAQPFFARFRF